MVGNVDAAVQNRWASKQGARHFRPSPCTPYLSAWCDGPLDLGPLRQMSSFACPSVYHAGGLESVQLRTRSRALSGGL